MGASFAVVQKQIDNDSSSLLLQRWVKQLNRTGNKIPMGQWINLRKYDRGGRNGEAC